MSEPPHEDWPLSSSYGTAYKGCMNAFHEGLWEHLDVVPALAPQTSEAVLRYVLELACQAQNFANIALGRTALLALPRDWLLSTIERAAEAQLDLDDDWEFLRLGEIYQHLDHHLVHRLAVRGLTSPNSAVQEFAREWADQGNTGPTA